MTLTKRQLVGVLALGVLFARPAKAQIPVYDPSRFVAMIKQLRAAADVLTQISAGADLLEDAARRLPTSVRSVDDILLGVRSLTSDVNAIGYRIETVTRQYNALFPDEAAIRDTDPRDAAELGERWDREVHLSSLAAARSQTSLSRIDTNTRAARDVLSQSSTEGSAVAQLQALVQMIQIINSDLASLSTTLAATGRVDSTLAATEASSREMAAERQRRLLEGYDTPPATEGIDDQFLRVR